MVERVQSGSRNRARPVGVSGRAFRGRGYNLVALAVFITVLNIMVAAVLPKLTQAMDREREEELIFRGLQYAEAIRVFQKRTGRFPVRLDELLETEPRSIRQLWTDPFRKDGLWGVEIAQAQRGSEREGRGQQRNRRGQARPGLDRRNTQASADREDQTKTPTGVPIQDVGDDRNRASRLSRQGAQTTGPIIGVRSLEKRETAKTFMGSNQASEWVFTADLIPALPAATLGDNVPRLNSQWIGRPFPQGLEPAQGAAPNDPLAGDAKRRSTREERQNRRNNRRGSRRNGNRQ